MTRDHVLAASILAVAAVLSATQAFAVDQLDSVGGGSSSASTASTRSGWTLGAGSEANDCPHGLCNQISLDYAHYDPNIGKSADNWGLNLSGLDKFNSFQLGGDLGYHRTNGSGFNVDTWSADTMALWGDKSWRLGPVIGYQANRTDFGLGSSTRHTFNYALAGEYYANDYFTLSGKLGGFNGNFSTNGAYGGLELTGYLTPNLALSGKVDFTHFNHGNTETDYGVQVEYGWTNRVGFYGGYSGADFSNSSFRGDNFYVGAKWYCDPYDLLRERHRGSVLHGVQSFSPLEFKF